MADPSVNRGSGSNSQSIDDPMIMDVGLSKVVNRLTKVLVRDDAVHTTLYHLQQQLAVNRVVLYYFYRHWQGQVTCEALSHEDFSILGSTGADDCFNDEHAALYLQGRVRAVADIEAEPIHDCHRTFLRSIQVKANLVVPVITRKGLWGLLVAHHCQSCRAWSDQDIEAMRTSAVLLAQVPAIQEG